VAGRADDLFGDRPPCQGRARPEQALDHLVIDRREELREIEAEHEAMAPGQLGGGSQAEVRAEASAARIGLGCGRVLDRWQRWRVDAAMASGIPARSRTATRPGRG
jgi:hypothetical protein